MADFDRLIIRRKRIDLSSARSLKEQAITFTHCRIDASSNAATASLRLHSTDNEPITIFNGRRLKNFQVDKLYIDNVIQAGEWIDLIFWGGPVMGPPEINDDALTAQIAGAIQIDDSNPVDVDVITLPDVKKVRVDAGQEFLGHGTQTAAASNYGHIQIHNPAASGIIVYVRSAKLSLTATHTVSLKRYDTALTGNLTTFENKDFGGAAPKADIRSQNSTTLLGAIIKSYKHDSFAFGQMIDGTPIRLGEGEGVLLVASTVNNAPLVSFEWSEI